MEPYTVTAAWGVVMDGCSTARKGRLDGGDLHVLQSGHVPGAMLPVFHHVFRQSL